MQCGAKNCALCHTVLVVWFLGRRSLTHCMICCTSGLPCAYFGTYKCWTHHMQASYSNYLPYRELGVENTDVNWFTPFSKVLRFGNYSVQDMTTKIYWVIVRFLKIRAVTVDFMANNRLPACVCVYFVDMADKASCTCLGFEGLHGRYWLITC
jgi:hypothetical protein